MYIVWEFKDNIIAKENKEKRDFHYTFTTL